MYRLTNKEHIWWKPQPSWKSVQITTKKSSKFTKTITHVDDMIIHRYDIPKSWNKIILSSHVAVGSWGEDDKGTRQQREPGMVGEWERGLGASIWAGSGWSRGAKGVSWLGWDGNGGSSQAGLGLDLIRFRKKKRFSFFVLIRIRVWMHFESE